MTGVLMKPMISENYLFTKESIMFTITNRTIVTDVTSFTVDVQKENHGKETNHEVIK